MLRDHDILGAKSTKQIPAVAALAIHREDMPIPFHSLKGKLFLLGR
jgi:hypothetical protein